MGQSDQKSGEELFVTATLQSLRLSGVLCCIDPSTSAAWLESTTHRLAKPDLGTRIRSPASSNFFAHNIDLPQRFHCATVNSVVLMFYSKNRTFELIHFFRTDSNDPTCKPLIGVWRSQS